MACPLPADQLKNLRIFIELLQKEPNFLYHPDLSFFKQYIESLGGVIPIKKSGDQQKQPVNEEEATEPAAEEVESAESEVELDYEGCIEPDNDPPQTMGYTEAEVSEEDKEKSNEKKQIAMEFYAEQKYEDAINAYTEAILLNPNSALLHAKRGQCYLQLKKPNACIRDCTRALEINPDNAAAYKFRGRAQRLLGNFLKAAEDLRNACKIDFDEQADEWLKEVTPNARKLEEHQRKYERKRLEKEVKETRERIRKMREEQQKRATEMKETLQDLDDEGIDGSGGNGGDGGGGGSAQGGGMGDFFNFMKDPEVMQAFQDPEVAAAFEDMCQNPVNILKYTRNPKVNTIVKKLSAKLTGQMPPGGFGGQMPPGFGGGFPGFFGGANQEEPKKPPPASDIDLD